MANSRICSIPDCGKPHWSRGWCSGHYQRWRTHGSPLKGGRPQTPAGEPERYYREVVLPYEGDECLIWPYGTNGMGYAGVWRGEKKHLVHRLACEEANGPPPTPKHEAAHCCGNGHEGCVNKRHVSWKTHAENMVDKIAHGTSNRGERHPLSKLTNHEARQIRALKGRKPAAPIAQQFGIACRTVYAIWGGRRHVS